MSDKEYGKLTRMKTHLYLVKMIQRKRLENEANAPPEDGKKRGGWDDDEYEFDGTEDEVDSPEAFLDLFREA